MKKSFFKISILALFISQNLNAEYMVKIPLEQEQGGALPNESIIIKTNWQNAPTEYTEWINNGSVIDCNNWSPSSSTITVGQSFTQTATDCQQPQVRNAQDKEIETISGIIQNKGLPYVENRTIQASSTRTSIGTKETWVAAAPTYTSWVNTNTLYGCTNWTPAGSTRTSTATFTQTATNCSTDQYRTKQDREQETTTLAYRNVGTVVAENSILTDQTATRSYTVTLGSWTNNGGLTGCSNWSPAPSTINNGVQFTQTATNCSQPQTRTRVERYVDHKSGSNVQVSNTTESRTLTAQESTRLATGTKPTTPTCSYSRGSTVWTEEYISTGYKIYLRRSGTLIYSTTMSEAAYWNWDSKVTVNGVLYTTNYDGKEYGSSGDSHSLCWY